MSASVPEPAPRRGDARARLPSWGLPAGATLAPGRTVVRPLGGGKRCEILLVRDERLGGEAVAKVLRPHVTDHPLAVRRLRREGRVLRRLSHPSVISCSDVDLDAPHPHLVLEYVEGPTLKQLIVRRAPLAMARLLPLALDLASVLDHLTARGVVHCDFKPQNVIAGPRTCVIDFGNALSVGAGGARPVTRTDEYLPPERRLMSPAADVWALGVMLYHAAAGRRPFPARQRDHPDPVAQFPQIAHDPAPLPPELPEPVSALILSALSRRPESRPTAAQLVAELGRLALLLLDDPGERQRRAR